MVSLNPDKSNSKVTASVRPRPLLPILRTHHCYIFISLSRSFMFFCFHLFIIVFMVVCFVCFCLILYIMYFYFYLYVLLLLYLYTFIVMYILFCILFHCVVLRIVCVYTCTVILPPLVCIFCFIVSFYTLFVCKCVMYYCHRVSTQLQLTNILFNTAFCVFENLRLRYPLRDSLTSNETEMYLNEFFCWRVVVTCNAFTSEGNITTWYMCTIILFEALIDTVLTLWGLWSCGWEFWALLPAARLSEFTVFYRVSFFMVSLVTLSLVQIHGIEW